METENYKPADSLINETNEPEYLYKYYSFDPSDDVKRQRIERIFTQNEIYFPSPRKFNDPFDSKIRPSYEGTKKEWKDYLRRIYKNHFPKWTKKQVFDEVTKILNQKRYMKLPKTFGDSFLDKMGVFCMSEIKDNILMWSHYSSGHTGFVLEFATVNPFFGRSQKIIYKDEYPKIRFFGNTQAKLTEAMLLTKAIDWEYEREYRLINHDKGPGWHGFPQELLTGVIFGCEMPEENKKMIRGWYTNRRRQPNLYQAKIKEREFGLDIVHMDYAGNILIES